MSAALAVARYTLVELSRRRILLVFFAVGAVGIVALGLFFKILYSQIANSQQGLPNGVDKATFDRFVQLGFLSDLYAALSIFALLIAYAIGMTAIYHDLDSGSAVSILSKPITRLSFASGKVGAAIVALVGIVGVLAIEARLVMLLFPGGLEDSLTGEVIAGVANVVVVMLLVLALSTWMNNIVAVVVAFVYYDVVAAAIVAVRNLLDNGAFNQPQLKAVFDVLYWFVPHELTSSAAGEIARASLQLQPQASTSAALAAIPAASGPGDVAWWGLFVVLFAGLVYYSVRRRQV